MRGRLEPSPAVSPKSKSEKLAHKFYSETGKLKLHEAMEIVLMERQNQAASTKKLSDEIWERKLYWKKDGRKAKPFQIYRRAKNCSQFEVISTNTIKLIPKFL